MDVSYISKCSDLKSRNAHFTPLFMLLKESRVKAYGVIILEGRLYMKIKLFDGSRKKIEEAVNNFIAQSNIKVIKIKMRTSVNGTVVMVIYE